MPLKPPSSFAKPSEAGQTPEAKGEGKMLGSEPLQMGGRAPSRKSTRKNYTPKNNQTVGLFIGFIPHFYMAF